MRLLHVSAFLRRARDGKSCLYEVLSDLPEAERAELFVEGPVYANKVKSQKDEAPGGAKNVHATTVGTIVSPDAEDRRGSTHSNKDVQEPELESEHEAITVMRAHLRTHTAVISWRWPWEKPHDTDMSSTGAAAAAARLELKWASGYSRFYRRVS
jgi:hypothetical protein